MNIKRLNLLLPFLVWLFLTTMVHVPGILAKDAVPTPSPSPAGDTSIHITSDTMEFDRKNNQVIFSGNVVARRLDTTLKADYVKVYLYGENEKKPPTAATGVPGDDTIKSLEARGNVQVKEKDNTATADQAVYSTGDQTIVLTGDAARVVSGDSWITGRKITLFQADNRVVVESDGTKRVNAFFDGRTPER